MRNVLLHVNVSVVPLGVRIDGLSLGLADGDLPGSVSSSTPYR